MPSSSTEAESSDLETTNVVINVPEQHTQTISLEGNQVIEQRHDSQEFTTSAYAQSQNLSEAHNIIVNDIAQNDVTVDAEDIVLQETVVPYESEEISNTDNHDNADFSSNQDGSEFSNTNNLTRHNLRQKSPRKYDFFNADFDNAVVESETTGNISVQSSEIESLEPPVKKSKRTEDENFDMSEFFKEENEYSGDESSNKYKYRRRNKYSKFKSDTSSVQTSETISSMLSIPSETLICDPNVNRLSVKLVKLLRDAPEGLLDLKTVATCLNSRNKRRIYDIVNVLTGVGLVEKDPNSSVLIWKGGGPFSNSRDVKLKLAATRKENERLQKLEITLEKHRFQIEQSLKILTDDLASQKFMYVSQTEVANCFRQDQTAIAVEAAVGSKVQCPDLSQFDANSQFELRVISATDSVKVKLLRPFDYAQLMLTGTQHLANSCIEVSPQPLQTDYRQALDETEGVFDLFC